jgi:protoporphyrinogen oxidase
VTDMLPGAHAAAPSAATGRTPDGPVPVAVLGAGPAGLTAAYVLARRGIPALVFEATDAVGGIARTVVRDGYRFDLGGHRFFTKLAPIERLWHEMLGDEFLLRPRLSRIYYRGKFLRYPLSAREVPSRLGVLESALCVLSYARARLTARRRPAPASFEEWVTGRFGRRLYDAFFRSYTEKVWGIPGSEIRAEWAAQRIKNFSLPKALLSVLRLRREHVTTLIEEFHYPRLGPGQMWEAFRDHVEALGVPVRLEQPSVALRHRDGRVTGVVVRDGEAEAEHPVGGVVSTLALRDLVLALDPPAPPEVAAAARRLRYRALVLVALVLDDEQPFEDNWIYLHDPETRAGRVQNFGAWSDGMVRPGTTSLGVEYFCFEDDEIWRLGEQEAVELATAELARIGLIDPARVIDGCRVHVPKAYPVYDGEYAAAVATIRGYLEGLENLQTCGRNGLHRYNNQDHSMWTAVLATLNLLDGAGHDVWAVNTDADYLEEGGAGGAVDGALELEVEGPPELAVRTA